MKHILYEDGDKDAPSSIKDRNGDIVLEMCKVCRRAEIQLIEDPDCSVKRKEI